MSSLSSLPSLEADLLPSSFHLYQGTKAEGAIQHLFMAKMKSYIKCVDVDYESARSENYYGESASSLLPFLDLARRLTFPSVSFLQMSNSTSRE